MSQEAGLCLLLEGWGPCFLGKSRRFLELLENGGGGQLVVFLL